MGLIDSIKEIFGGASEHIDTTVQRIGDSEVAQHLEDTTTELKQKADDTVTSVNDKFKPQALIKLKS